MPSIPVGFESPNSTKKPALVCTCSYVGLSRASLPAFFTFRSWAHELYPKHASCSPKQPMTILQCFCWSPLNTWTLASSPVNCRITYLYFVGSNPIHWTAADDVSWLASASFSLSHPVFCPLVIPIARTDTENLFFCPGGTRSTLFALPPGRLWQLMAWLCPDVSADLKLLLLRQFPVCTCDKSLTILQLNSFLWQWQACS